MTERREYFRAENSLTHFHSDSSSFFFNGFFVEQIWGYFAKIAKMELGSASQLLKFAP